MSEISMEISEDEDSELDEIASGVGWDEFED